MTADQHLLATLQADPGWRLLVTAERGSWQVRDTRADKRLPRRYSNATITKLFGSGQLEDISPNQTILALTPGGHP